MKCLDKSNLPYPKIKVQGKNFEYSKLLLEDYAGLVSETTAIFLYSFQHISKKTSINDFSKIVEKIAITEMRHLEILGETISLLGTTPCFKTFGNDNCNFWNSYNVCYTNELRNMLEVDIISEQKAINQYIKHRELINDNYIKQAITRILEDEYDHLACFKNMYKFFAPTFN